jgi:hypothetical protein
MKPIKRNLILTTILAGLSLAALGLGHLALTDIYHGEGDLALEWWLLRLAALVFVAFIASTLFLVRGVYKTLR